MTKHWEVLVRVQAYQVVDADTQEEAEAIAESEFDPTAYDTEVVEAYPCGGDES